MQLNLPTALGYELGAELDRLYRESLGFGEDKRCHDCAFRKGTFPNGCSPTLMDAIKCVTKPGVFYCHINEGKICEGFAVARHSISGILKEAESIERKLLK